MPVHFLDRVHRPASGPVAVGIVLEVSLEDGFDHDLGGSLNHGIRIIMTKEAKREPNDPGLNRILRAAVKRDFPVNILCWGNVDAGTALIDRLPDPRFIMDHLAFLQPRIPRAPPHPWADLPKVLDLATRKNA